MTDAEINDFDLNKVNGESDYGYILDVDIGYPDELPYLHDDYPLASNKIEVTGDMLSKYCSDIAKKFNLKLGEVKKIVPNLENRKKIHNTLQKLTTVYITRYEGFKNT